MPNLIALAIPFFLLLIGIELWAARHKGVPVYRLNDAVVDLSSGILQQVFLVFWAAALVSAYVVVRRDRDDRPALPCGPSHGAAAPLGGGVDRVDGDGSRRPDREAPLGAAARGGALGGSARGRRAVVGDAL
jgi:hypothetical protein